MGHRGRGRHETDGGEAPTGRRSESSAATAERSPLRPGRHGRAVCERLADAGERPRSRSRITEAEMEAAVDRYRSRVRGADPPPASSVRDWLGSLTDAGRWPDVDYDDRSRTNWAPATALDRVADLARAYHADGHPHCGADAVRAGAVGALDYWLSRAPESDNWWWNDIGAPQRMREVVVTTREWLTDDQRRGALAVLGRTDPDGTGANLLWTAEIAFLHGCLVGDAAAATAAARAAASEVHLTSGDGVQADDSFHQHGPRLQQYHYGASFVTSSVSFADLVRDTAVAFPDAALDLLASLLLEGHRWMQRGGYASPSTLDRSVSRTGALRVDLADACRRLAPLVESGSDALRAFASHVEAGAPAESPPVTGHRAYWASDFAVHHGADFFASVKYVSPHTRPTESINEENLKGAHLTDGALFVTRRGDEYEGVFPVWDWRHVPGVTARAGGADLDPGTSGFAGSLSDGRYGLTGLDVAVSGGVAARKAWFFGDETVICLGAGIGASEAPDAPVTTTLAQRPLVGPVRCGVGDEVDRVETGETLEGRALDWLHHDGVGYVFPARTPATVSTRVQTGSWHDINHAHGEETVSTPVFASWIDHGVAPGEESYAYVLRPGVGADAMPAVASDPGIDVLANDPAAQAVHLPAADLVGAVFYEPGRVASADGPSLAVDDRCLLQVRERGTATVATVADPSRSLDAVTLTLGERAWTVPLPDCSQGRAAGTTVSLGEVSLGPD